MNFFLKIISRIMYCYYKENDYYNYYFNILFVSMRIITYICDIFNGDNIHFTKL